MNTKRTWAIGAVLAAFIGVPALGLARDSVTGPWAALLVIIALLGPPLIGGIFQSLRQEKSALWANLFWKEWREHQWKLAALTAITLGTYFGLFFGTFQEDGLSTAYMVLTASMPLAAFFVGMGLGAGEQTAGTDHLLRALPATPRRAAIAKLLVGIVVVIAPGFLLIAIAGVLFQFDTLFEWPEDPFDLAPNLLGTRVWPIESAFAYLLIGASLLIWCVALGMNRTSELRAGAVAIIGVIAVWLIATHAVRVYTPRYEGAPRYASREYAQNFAMVSMSLPGGTVSAHGLGSSGLLRGIPVSRLLVAIAASLLVHGVLVWRWITGYAATAAKERQTSQSPGRVSNQAWLGAPLASPGRAVLWKQLRECLPLAGGVAALGVGWAGFLMLAERGAPPPEDRVWVVVWITMMSGFLAALFVGIGGFQDDLNSGLSAFWRSRPIDPNQWFWLKYAGGLATLAAVFGGAYLLALLLDGEETLENSDYPARFLAAFWVTYAVAVLAACTIRNAVYAAILAFVAVNVIVVTTITQENRLPASVQLLILLAAGAGVTLLAWQAMRRDWRFGA